MAKEEGLYALEVGGVVSFGEGFVGHVGEELEVFVAQCKAIEKGPGGIGGADFIGSPLGDEQGNVAAESGERFLELETHFKKIIGPLERNAVRAVPLGFGGLGVAELGRDASLDSEARDDFGGDFRAGDEPLGLGTSNIDERAVDPCPDGRCCVVLDSMHEASQSEQTAHGVTAEGEGQLAHVLDLQELVGVDAIDGFEVGMAAFAAAGAVAWEVGGENAVAVAGEHFKQSRVMVRVAAGVVTLPVREEAESVRFAMLGKDGVGL